MNIVENLKFRNIENLNKTAIYFYDQFRLNSRLTYKELFSEVDRFSGILQRNKIEGIVILSLDDPYLFIFYFLALVQIGAVPVPIISFSHTIKDDFLNRTAPLTSRYNFSAVICDQKAAALFSMNLPVFFAEANDLTSYSKAPTSALNQAPVAPAKELCFIQFSSGSTSLPKGIEITHERLIRNLEQIIGALQPTKEDKLISWLPLYHDMGLIGGVFSPLFAGGEAHLMRAKDFIGHADQYLQLVDEHKITFLLGPDFMYRHLTKELLRKDYNIEHLKVCMSGSELVLASTVREFKKACQKSGLKQNVFLPVYGMAEACLGVSFHKKGSEVSILPIKENDLENKTVEIKTKGRPQLEIVGCGTPLQGQDLIIVNDSNQVAPELAIGEICIRGLSIFKSYYQKPSEEIPSFQNYFRTGDEGFVWQGHIYPLGRKKDVVIQNGIKFYSVDLESFVYNQANKFIGRVACVQDRHQQFHLVAEVKWGDFLNQYGIRQKIFKIITQRLSIRKENIHIAPKFDLPRTTSGKIQRYQIIERVHQGFYAGPFFFLRRLIQLFWMAKN